MKNYITNFKSFINEGVVADKKNKLNEQEGEFNFDVEDIDIQPHGRYDISSDEGSEKVYVLSLMVDISSTPGAMIESIIKISRNKEELEQYMNSLPEIEYDEEDQEYDGMSVSDAPYYNISEHRLND